MSHNKYTDLHSLHEQLRTAKTDGLNSASQNTVADSVTSKNSNPDAQSFSADKHISEDVAHRAPDTTGDKKSSNSSAQVAISVLPQVVLPKSCELKLKEEEAASGKRPSPLTLRASETQKEKIRQKAQAAGLSVGRYIIAVALGPDYIPPVDPDLRKELLALNKELTARGNNLNQIAKHLNGGTTSPAEGEGMLGRIGRSMLLTHRAIRAALSRGKEPEP